MEVLDVTGAGITVLSGGEPGPICVSDAGVAGLENLQFDLAQGPCRDAFSSGRTVHAPQLDASHALRWPPFVELAYSSGIRAVSAYPLINETAGVGVLTLYRAHEGDLSEAQHHDGVAVARVLTDTLLSLRSVEPVASTPDEAVTYRAEIYQASGMVAVQLGVAPGEALLRIRAHGVANGMSALDVAIEVVALRLRLGSP
ncbi:hypothetical protein BH23ACT3_BH23ACT3_13830 [soil metagenome]